LDDQTRIAGWDHTRGPEAMARWMAVLYVCGSTLSLLALALPHWQRQNTTATVICALAAYPAAAVLVLWGRRLPRLGVHLMLALGTALITLGVYFGNQGVGSLTAAVFYIWVALYAFNFFTRRAASAHIGVIAAGYGAVLWIEHVQGGAAQWLLVVGTAVVSGIVVAMLVEEVRSVARRDGLTGVWNRRALEEDVDRHLASANRDPFDITLAILDLDHFKECNSQFGHHGADALLVELATSWSNELRASDCLARYGGDEFAIVFPRSTLAEVVAVIERLRQHAPSGITFSAGVAAWTRGESGDALERRADAALFTAKREGKNRTVTAASPEPTSDSFKTPGEGVRTLRA
jgi:diguanylate cyclase (GGDEF)-like protein